MNRKVERAAATGPKRGRRAEGDSQSSAADPEASPSDRALAAELQILRAENDHLRRRAAEAERTLARVKNTVAYQLGETLLQTRSLAALLKLPGRLAALRTLSNEKRRAAGDRAAPRAAALAERAKALRASDLGEAIRLGEQAVALDPSPQRLTWLAGLTYDAGMIERPASLLRQAEAQGHVLSIDQKARLETLAGLERVRRNGLDIPAGATAPRDAPVARSVAYVAASSLPHHVNGYTRRTHDLARALQELGWRVSLYTRPGYPWDRPDALRADASHTGAPVEGLAYERLPGPAANRTGLDDYIEQAAQSLALAVAAKRPALVHAASNHVNALPALIAARRAGLPFVYEVRGLWELTAAQRSAAGEGGERFELGRDLEILTAREADAVVALNGSLAEELVRRGVPEDRIAVAPSGVDAERFAPRPPDPALKRALGLEGRYVLGFVGSIVDYEGLDDAVDALARLRAEGVDAALLAVGAGAASQQVADHARALGLADRVVMPGRVGSQAVPGYYSVIDVAVFPRKPVSVAETVSPLKPLEAMAMARPVVASSVAGLADVIRDGETGLLFSKGDTADFARTVARLHADPALAARLGAAGRAHVQAERSWEATAAVVASVYERLLA